MSLRAPWSVMQQFLECAFKRGLGHAAKGWYSPDGERGLNGHPEAKTERMCGSSDYYA
ncbi:MAG: hypothetical protein QXN94_01595 [Thermofilaceae archaeon]